MDWSGNFSFFQDLHITKGWQLQLHKTYDHQNWTASTTAGVDWLGTKLSAAGDVMTLRSCDFKKL